jgi:hypothetical protein
MAEFKVTRYRLGPPFPPSTHLLFLKIDDRPGVACCICLRPAAEPPRTPFRFPCERCGRAMHSDCHWGSVASPAERRRFARADLEDDELLGLIFLCQGCRS